MKKTIQIIILLVTLAYSSFAQTVDLQKGLVAYYPFNINANDESGNGNNGIVYGASLTSDRNGILNGAYSFNGQSDYITTNNIIQNLNSFTITFWINITSYTHKNYMTPLSQQVFNYSYLGSPFAFYIGEAESFGLKCLWKDKSNLDMRIVQSLSNNVWKFITITYDSSNLKQFIDCNMVNQKKYFNKQIRSNFPLLFGKGYAYPGYFISTFFHGKMDEIRIYNRALNQEEINTLYNYQEATLEAPSIIFNNPSNSYITVNQSIFNFDACIESSEPLKNYAVYINGANNRVFNVDTSSYCYFKINTPLNLQEGNNTIKIVAENLGGSTTSSTYTINYVKLVTDNTPSQIPISNPNVFRGFKPVEQQNINDTFNTEITSQIDLTNYFIEANNSSTNNLFLVIGDSIEIKISPEVYKMNDNQFFYVSYIYNNERINKRLNFKHDTLILNEKEIYTIDGKSFNPSKPLNMIFYYYDQTLKVPVSYLIQEFCPIFISIEKFRRDVEDIVNQNKENPINIIAEKVNAALRIKYGKFHNTNLLKCLKYEFNL